MSSLHPIQSRVRAVASKARRLRLIYAVAWLVTVALTAGLLLGVLDVLFRFRDPGVRIIASLLWLSAVGWTFYRLVLPGLRYQQSDVQVAQRIERRFPTLRDRLSSSVAFLGQSELEATAGSADLRKAVISQTIGESESLNFFECLDSSRAKRAAGMAVAAAVLAGTVVALAPANSTRAAVRLLMPWGGPQWPRQHSLAFENSPTRLARGQDFVATVIDQHGELPEQVMIEYRFDGVVQAKPMRFVDGKMVHRLNNVAQSFAYRAVGGDDQQMPWQQVDVVDPPELADLQVVVVPPEYTGFPAEPQSEPHITATEGSRLIVTGRSTKPLREVVLRLENKAILAGAPGETIVGKLSDSSQSFELSRDDDSAPLVLAESGRYWLELTDDESGVPSPTERWEVRVSPDAPPSISIEQPVGNLLVTSQAEIPIEALAQDDLGIQDVTLQYSVTGPSNAPRESEILLYSIDEQQEGAATLADAEANSPGPAGASAGNARLHLSYQWDLREVSGLQPQDVIEFRLVVRDLKPQAAESSIRRISLISNDALEERIAQKRSYILSQLAEVLRVQRQGRSQTRSLEIQLEQTQGQFRQSDVNRLQSAELNQRQVEQLMTQPSDGVEAQITALLDDIARNRLDSPDVVARMTELLQAVRRIAGQDLPLIERDMLTALRAARSQWQDFEPSSGSAPDSADEETLEVDPLVRTSIESAGRGQEDVIQQLEQLLGELSEWDSYRRFSRMVNRILADQEDLSRDTEKIRLDTITKDESDLTDQEKADLRQLSQRQLELARRVESVQSTMQQLQNQLQATDPVAAQTVADAMETARRLAISGQMREGARRIEQNQVGRATEYQQDAAEAVNELLDVLANRREHELGRQLRKLEQARTDLKQLQQRQKGLRKQMEQAAEEPDAAEKRRQLERLQREQEAVRKQTEELGRRLERLQAEASKASLSQAGERQQQAGQSAQQGDAAAAADQARQAEQLLDQAEQQLDQQIQQAQQDLVAEQLAQFGQILQGFEMRQKALNQTTSELAAGKDESLEWSREQLATLNDLAGQQQFLAGDVGDLLPQFEQAEAFSLALRGIVREMTRAANLLERQQPGPPTQQAQKQALERVQQLIESLKPEVRQEANDEPSPMGGGNANPPPNPDALTTLAELKLVQLMQQEISGRTGELEEIRQRQGELSPTQLQEQAELAVEQGRLSRILLNLSVPPPSPEGPDGGLEEGPDADEPELPPLDKALEESLKQ